jgi:predicted amidohydrolase YtcJ
MLKNALFPVTAILFFTCCSQKKETADLIIHNAKIYAVDSSFSVFEAMAIKQGSILATGTNKEILHHYDAPQTNDLKGAAVYPGIIDAHCHFLAYGLGLGRIDLVGTRSFEEIVQRVAAVKNENFADQPGKNSGLKKEEESWILGRGWDQNDWENKEMPDNHRLDSIFPNRPVMLTRIDGHAVLVNSEALRRAGINGSAKITGGEIQKKNGKLTGVLVDNAIDLIRSAIPETSDEEKEHALLNAQQECFAMGLTTVDDAGLMFDDIDLMDKLQKNGKLKMRIYAMLSDSAPNYERYLKSGPYKSERLNVRSFKFYVDGALGSRGACLFEDYSDKPGWKGFLLSPASHFKKYADILDKKGFQMNAHCIGDSALHVMMNVYINHCNEKGQHRWRIEHAQVTGDDDFKEFSNDIIPSVQPTHATSDMYWLQERLGKKRAARAYAYKQLLEAAGLVALGTDFPVEDISPFKTFYAAVARMDLKGFPEKGFQTENALTREETLKGMTIWAAYSNFEEKEKGSLEPGKLADFVILDQDLMTEDLRNIPNTKVSETYIRGEKVYSSKKQNKAAAKN